MGKKAYLEAEWLSPHRCFTASVHLMRDMFSIRLQEKIDDLQGQLREQHLAMERANSALDRLVHATLSGQMLFLQAKSKTLRAKHEIHVYPQG